MSYMRSPAFQFYPSNYLGSRAVRLMDAEQRGWYTQLLFESWESEPQATLPNDDALLRVLAGVNTCSADVEQRWVFVKKQFRQKGKYIYNARLLEEFAKQDEFRAKRREAGKASGEARRAQREEVKTQHLSRNGNKRLPVNTRSTSVPLCSDSVRTKDEHNRTLNTPTPSPTPDSIKEKKGVRADKPHDPRRTHPALVAIRETKGSLPPKEIWDSVIETLGEHPDVPLLKKCWVTWRTKGYAPTNYGWLVDWYPNGIQGGNNGTGKQHNETAADRRARTFSNQLAVVAELRGEGRGDSDQDASGERGAATR